MKNLLPRFVYALLAILVLSAVILTLGQRESQTNASATSYNPSGFHALQELLQRNGIPTEVTRFQQPKLQPTDLVVAPYLEGIRDLFDMNSLETIEKALQAHVKRGGRVLVIPLDRDFRESSNKAIAETTEIVNQVTQQHLKVHHAPILSDNSYTEDGEFRTGFMTPEESGPTFTAWSIAGNLDTPFVSFVKSGEGTLANVSSGLFATNRFIDRADDAEFAVRLIQGMLPKGGRVVFAEASMGHGIEPSLVSTLGPWATGIWMQLIVFFLVIVFTLGIRFGLPGVTLRGQRGQREMIDAISYIYRRARSPEVALDAAYASADARIRRAFKLPSGLSPAERDASIPSELALMLRFLHEARQPRVVTNNKGVQRLVYDITPEKARELIVRVESQLAEHLPSSRNRIS